MNIGQFSALFPRGIRLEEQLLDTKRRSLSQESYCSFSSLEWHALHVDLGAISREIDRRLATQEPPKPEPRGYSYECGRTLDSVAKDRSSQTYPITYCTLDTSFSTTLRTYRSVVSTHGPPNRAD